MRCGVGERLDDLQLLDDRAGPPVRDDQRQRVGVPGADVDEMNVQPVDLGDEVRQVVQSRLARTPVIVRSPVAHEVLHHREPDALRVVGDRLALGPPGSVHASAQLGKLRLRETDLKRADGVVVGRHLLLLTSAGCSPDRIARAWAELMRQPGYQRRRVSGAPLKPWRFPHGGFL
jgi:hypothetical protein